MKAIPAAIEAKMHRQPPESNNPANPLLKIAALDLNKQQETTGPNQTLKIMANLTFKQSNDLKGHTRTNDGQQITVTFGLGIKRASFRIVFSNENDVSPNGLVSIKKVAFAGPLALKSQISETLAVTGEVKSNLELTASAGVEMGAAGFAPGAKAGGKASVSAAGAKKRSRRVSSKSEITNVSATFGGNEIHWEINPVDRNERAEPDGFLEGNVFVTSRQGRAVDACIVERKDGGPVPLLVVSGSVFITMDNLVVGKIAFMDEDGNEIPIRRIKEQDQENATGAVTFLEQCHKRIFRKSTEERILRQIIRKHLLEQGMSVDGAALEICRARA